MFLTDKDMIMHGLLCKNSYNLRELLKINLEQEGYLQTSPTEYYIATVLDEIIRLLTSIIRWEDDFKDGFDSDKVKTLLGNLIIQGMNNEINMYLRKFMETLVNLLLWKNLSDERYIKYYYLVNVYNSLKNEISDLDEFYNIRSERKGRQLTNIENLILQESIHIDENKCFFIFIGDSRSRTNIKGTNLYLKESSYRYKLKKALKSSDNLDKLLLGFTYERYSYASSKIHFNSNIDHQHSEVLANTIRFMMVMINRIICLCGEVLEITDLDEIKNLDVYMDKLKSSIGWYTPLTKDIYDIDDYVYTLDGKLGRITEKKTSRKYGYKSYKILFLNDNGENIVEDYFPAHEFKRIQPKEKLYDMVFKSQPQFKGIYEENPDEVKLKSCLDEAIKVVWELSLKDKYINNKAK
ncbi:hypothetical protein JCM10914A_28560 [Paenibacillus sp. JCM 10914]|uniref:hypothetical protein n=1 Tax=Paenibacillus sp. JCM 10914 TaxID=1236974 RepID=UPI0003CC635A|nr:hypothetical protein [Paenibacillus sp. JCM 10914]GAE08396.1 hypothetical protein JCM10914_4687 [Paenibacillus sp. JCM 10914]